MNKLLLASVVMFSTVVANSGCLGCGAYEGGGNLVYERNSEMLLLCENGGFVAVLETQMVEGRVAPGTAPVVSIGTRGEDGQLAFELIDSGNGLLSTPQFGAGDWSYVALDATALDHSNVLCNDLEYRTWWTQTPAE